MNGYDVFMSKTDDIKGDLNNLGIELSADKIWNQLKNIRNLKKEDKTRYARRLIWELFQNAKDLAEDNNLEIVVSFKNHKLIFEHNGKNFTSRDLLSLVTQKSSKSFLTDEKITGKFGTGFITTHLLSEKVIISGVLSNSTNSRREFEFHIDRSGETINKIKDTVQIEISEIEKLTDDFSNQQIHSLQNKTSFCYNLDHESFQLAQKSVEDIRITIPFIFMFIKSISKVFVNTEDSDISYNILESGKWHECDFIKVDSGDSQFNIISLSNEKASISIPISFETNTIIPLDKYMPRLFCDFPIIGSERYKLPFVINCSRFDVTEPRDEIFDNTDNCLLLSKTTELYGKLIDRLSQLGFYNMFLLSPMAITNDIISSGIIKEMKSIYEKKPLILCTDDNAYSLKDQENKAVIFPFDEDENIIFSFWKIINQLSLKRKLPVWDNYRDWLKVVGKEYQITIAQLIEHIEGNEFLNELILKDNSENAQAKWIDMLLDILEKKGELQNTAVTHSIIPNQKNRLQKLMGLVIDKDIDEKLKDILLMLGEDIRENLLHKDITHEFDNMKEYNNKDIADKIKNHVFRHLSEENKNQRSREKNVGIAFNDLLLWFSENDKIAYDLFGELYSKNKHKLYDETLIVTNIEKAKKLDEFSNVFEKYNIKDCNDLTKLISSIKTDFKPQTSYNKENLTEEILAQLGIDSQEALDKALGNSIISDNFIHQSSSDAYKFEYVEKLLSRSKETVLKFLKSKSEYNLDNIIEVDKTIFLVKKNEEDIYIIIRPSDYEQVIIYYDSEVDLLDYEKDWELWVENGKIAPQKISLGKIIRITGINKIPLKRIR